MYFCMSFFIPWVYQWFFDFSYITELNIPIIAKKHKIKWWGSFKNSTTEAHVKTLILKQAPFPAISYSSKLTLQEQPSFGAQKAQ